MCAAVSLGQAAETAIEIGAAAARTAVPRWDAKGVGALPWQGIADLDVSDDGRWIAVGTIAPPGDPNLFLLDASGQLVGQYRAGHRWISEVAVSHDGRFVAGLSTTPEGSAGDTPRLYAFRQGQELLQVGDRFKVRDFRPAGGLFHYGDHSNHLPRVSRWAGERWVVVGDEVVYWLSPGEPASVQQAHLGSGVTTTMAASPDGRVIVGRRGGVGQPSDKFRSLLVMQPDPSQPIVWSRPVSTDVAPARAPERGCYGPPAPPYDDVPFQAPLAVASDAAGKRFAVADYAGWQRVFHPRDGSDDVPFGTRFVPSRPTIHVYDADGHALRRVGPESFAEAFWCDLAFSADGRKLLIRPHTWTCRGLAGQPFLPADERACTLYVLDVGSGSLQAIRFPDAIASADFGSGQRLAVGCWDGHVYLLDESGHAVSSLPHGRNIGAAGLVRVAPATRQVIVATAAGTVRMLDPDGKELWQTDLNKAAQPGEKRWTRNQKADPLAPGIWRTNGGLAHSDLGSQIVIEAPQGLILIDPNAGASFEQNWARIQGAGLEPLRLKYLLLTHEHGDHAPGASLWRAVTGAQVVASAEMAYVLQHHIPGGTGYGFHPPQPVDIALTEDRELDLAGLKVQALRLPGHTSGSMGYAFQQAGRMYVATGDLIMPGGVLGYSGSLDFSAPDVLRSLQKLAALRPDTVLGGHGGGDPDEFIAKGIEAGEATGWSRMPPTRPTPLYRFAQTNYLVAAWLEPILSAAFGDLDGDGRPDVAVLVPNGRGSAVKIYLNQGGKFAATPDAQLDLADLSRGWKLRLVRFGRGPTPDLFVSSEGQAVLLLAQPGRLQYRAVPCPVTRGTQVAAVAAGDAQTQLVIGSRFVTGFGVASQQPDGTVRVRQTKSPGQIYFDIALVDVNGDQRDDLIVSSGDVFLGQPDGSLAETPALHLAPPPGEPPGWAFLAAADFDQDAWPDVALLANSTTGVTAWLYRHTRNPQAPFGPEPGAKFVIPDTEVNRDGPTTADWNGDGIADLILSARGKPPGACVLTGSRTDGLNAARVISVKLDYTPHFDTRFGVADFDGDGRVDVAGFGRSPVDAAGIYIWLQPAAKAAKE